MKHSPLHTIPLHFPVANKILSERFGSNNFVADLPIYADTSLGMPSLGHQLSLSNTIFNHHKETQNFKVFVSTWNVGGVAPNEDLDMEDWLDAQNNSCDIYVLGFQELVPLRALNVLGPENNKMFKKWNSLIRKALNKKSHSWDKIQNDKLGEVHSLSPINEGKSNENNIPHEEFRCIISKQMVGICISVWIRSDLRPYIRHPGVSCVGCGIMGCLGNKGSVSVRFHLHETSFCFVCSHLASGGREGDEKYRNSDVAEILSRTSFPSGGPSLNLPQNILDHDQVIFLGDLNYRISLPEETTRLLVERREWYPLLENDQLRMELMDGQIFQGWNEGKIKFAPTYKYCPNSDIYYGCVQRKKSKKWRAPAWCDRIIWNGKGLKQHLYARGETKLSDHRPVKAIFSAEVEILRTLKGIQSYFMSERLDRITNHFEISLSDDNFPCPGRASSFEITG